MESPNEFYKNYQEHLPLEYFLGTDDKAPNSYYEAIERVEGIEEIYKPTPPLTKHIANDILDRIKRDFKEAEINEVLKLLRPHINEGPIVTRCLVFLAKGSIEVLKEYLESYQIYGPFNIMVWADEEDGGLGHYFKSPFPDTENLAEMLYADEIYGPPDAFYKDFEEHLPLEYFLGTDDKAPNSYYEAIEKVKGFEEIYGTLPQLTEQIAGDILDRIKHDFKEEEVYLVIKMLQPYIKYGPGLLRSMVFLASGKIVNFKNYIFKSFNTYGPYEIQNAANSSAGNPGHYFNIPFPETAKYTNNSMDFSHSLEGRIPVEHFLSIDDEPPIEFYETYYKKRI